MESKCGRTRFLNRGTNRWPILASGWFTSVGGEIHKDMARLDPVTGVADSFAPNLHGLDDRPSISSILVQPDGKVLIGGDFSSLLGQSFSNIARLNADGTPDVVFHPVVSADDHYGDIFAVALRSDGKVLLGGAIAAINGVTRNHIARVDGVTGAPDSFHPNASNQLDPVLSIAVQPDGSILAGGYFNSYRGKTRSEAKCATLLRDTTRLLVWRIIRSKRKRFR